MRKFILAVWTTFRGTAVLATIITLCLTSCGPIRPNTAKDPMVQLPGTGKDATVYLPKSEVDRIQGGRLFGDKGISLLGGTSNKGGSGIGVNAFLWRASLDTVAFLPLTSADPFGGVIITDWYSPPETPKERLKLTIYILDTALRADGLRVAVFRQHDRGNGQWRDEASSADVATTLENVILRRARELRIASIQTKR